MLKDVRLARAAVPDLPQDLLAALEELYERRPGTAPPTPTSLRSGRPSRPEPPRVRPSASRGTSARDRFRAAAVRRVAVVALGAPPRGR